MGIIQTIKTKLKQKRDRRELLSQMKFEAEIEAIKGSKDILIEGYKNKMKQEQSKPKASLGEKLMSMASKVGNDFKNSNIASDEKMKMLLGKTTDRENVFHKKNPMSSENSDDDRISRMIGGKKKDNDNKKSKVDEKERIKELLK